MSVLKPESTTSNLWEETIYELNNYSVSWDDVTHIYAYDRYGNIYEITKDNFEEVAKCTDYERHFYPEYITIDSGIAIVGENFYMERIDYSYGDAWMFRYIPNYPDCPKVHIDSLLFNDMRRVSANN